MKHLLSAIIAVVIFSSCTKNFEEINTNPNNPSTTDPNYIFNYVTKEAAGEYGIINTYNVTYIQRWIMQTAAVWGNSTMPPYTLFDQYRIQLIWEYYYSNLLLNCHILEDLTSEDPEQINKHQIARIWKVYCFHKVTDLWGDVPYSDAFKLLETYSSETIKPEYDSQESIYADFLSILEDATSKIDPSKAFFTNDMIFNGDLDGWIRFANSLRLRLAVRSGNEAVIAEIISENNLISSNEESALFQYIEAQEWWNPYYEININSKNPTSPELTGTTTPKVSELMMLQLGLSNDPRLGIYAQKIELDNTTYRGVPNLMNANLKENQAMGMGVSSTSYIGRYFSENPVLKQALLSYSEVCFLRAEAAFRNWTSDNAQEWYEKGVRSSMEFYGVDTTEIDNFLTNNGAFENSLEQIMVQKWVSLYLNGWEAFSDYRRTGFPQLKKYNLVLDGIRILSYEWADVDRKTLPGRLPYPDDEIDLNKENYLKAIDAQGGDSYYQQVWWSKKFGVINY
ncbi:MAG: SusD/RagB family nutrient-binding outer membrane lipoprotein [Bacteroidales bacterium]|nr:SusD/RagB family nutrient-binding outer membrane lipoprotein [Bacteroidales bacterium]MCF8391143.1 SusD/RagB family nutrient-binding outer membrane lipoprotein [Bacteroidales bacterium]